MGEARAALLAVQEGSFLSLDRLMFEGDAKVVVDAIAHSGESAPWQIEGLVGDIHCLIDYRPSWVFNHVNRRANELVHNLA